jgi:TRAP-type C4-dicarboxylate transport system permease small subunit
MLDKFELDKFEKFNNRLSGWFEWVGVAGLLAVMLVTNIDVIGAKLFLSPLRGTIDMVMLFQLVAVAFACASTLIIGRHVRVEFFVTRLPRRAQAIINSIVSLIGLGLFILIIWRLCALGYSFQSGGETTATAHIPVYPFAYLAALASIPVCLVLLHEFLSSLAKVAKR